VSIQNSFRDTAAGIWRSLRFVAISGAIALAPFSANAGYLATECKVELSDPGQNTFVVYLVNESHPDSGVYLVEFQKEGPLIRLPPEYYAMDWPNVEFLEFLRPPSDTLGQMSIHARNGSTQPIGKVKKSCWELLKRYLSDSHIAVQLKESQS
jgi:hypothetical protein